MVRSDGIGVLHTPDRVEAGRVFRVVLEVPEGQAPVKVTTPGSIRVVDRTPEDRSGETVFYFRAEGVRRGARLRFDGRASGAEVEVDCLDRAGILERREQGELRLPRRWPLWEEVDELKTCRTIFRQEELDRALSWGRRHTEEVRKVLKDAEGWASKGDGALWDLSPKVEIPRWHFVNLEAGCPVHGEAIYKYSGFYPWKVDVEGVPYKVQCPVGGERYPSNDIGADDFTSGPYPDDGCGFVKGNVKWAFVPVYQNERALYFFSGLRALVEACVRTGDEAMLHKVRVMLLRTADEWGYLSGKLEDRYQVSGGHFQFLERPRWAGPVTTVAELHWSGLVYNCISLAGDLVTYATAYDLCWEGIDGDRELLSLARERLGLGSGEEVRRYIETHLLRVGAQLVMDGGAHANMPYPQMGLTYVALALNYRSGRSLADWLWHGGGQMRFWLPNFFFRDGAGYESTGDYNWMHVDATPPIARGLARLQELQPEAYQGAGIGTFESDPKLEMIFRHLVEVMCIGRMYPQVGDSGYGPKPGNPPLERMYAMTQNPGTVEYAFETYGDPAYAQVLWGGKGYDPGPESRVSREVVEAVVGRFGGEIALESQAFDGYGLAILRSGGGDDARALWIRYGASHLHRQDDMLDIGLFAHARNLVAQLGYPYSWATHAVWDGNWLTHNRAKVVELERGMLYRGSLRSLSLSPLFQAVRADGEPYREVTGGKGRWEVYPDRVYSRWVCLVDVGERDFYVLDICRVYGGGEHWWSFHGPDGEAVVEGLAGEESWPDGTPAGRDIGYGEVCKLGTDNESLHSLTYLYRCRRGEVPGPWGATWRLSGDSGLELRMRQLGEDGEVIVGYGKPPISSQEDPPYRLTWTLAHRKGASPLLSQFVTLLEASQADRRVVRRVDRERAAGEGRFSPVVLRVETAAGTDLIVSAWESGSVASEAGGWTFDGEHGFARTRGGEVERVSLTGGGGFVVEGVGIARTMGRLSGEVVGGDFRSREVILSGIGDPEMVAGQYVRFESAHRSSAYKVLSAERASDGVRLILDSDIRIGEGMADGFEDGRIVSPTHFRMAGYRYYHGARLRARSGVEFLLDHIDLEVVATDARGRETWGRIGLSPEGGEEVSSERLSSAVGRGGSFVIYDLGVGDRATVTLTTWMGRMEDGVWEGRVGDETALSLGRGMSGTVDVSRGAQRWTLPVVEGGRGLSVVDLGRAGIGPGRIRLEMRGSCGDGSHR